MILLIGLLLVPQIDAQGQMVDESGPELSGKKAFALSLLLPGLGQRYANGGNWNASGTLFALIDAGSWTTLAGANWRERHYTESFENLAMAHAGAQVSGQSRALLLNVGQYNSSAEYVEFLLRARAWDRLEAAEAPDQQWEWDDEANRLKYRELRADADKMQRRTTWMAAILVGNRFISALSALRAVRKAQSRPAAQFGIAPGDRAGGMRVNVAVRF